MKVKRADLIQQLADEYGYTKKKAANIVDDFTSLIINNLEQGNSVLVRNLGCFDLLVRKERSCPNPVTGEKVIIPEHYIPPLLPQQSYAHRCEEVGGQCEKGVGVNGRSTEKA